jgi:glycosyltransferase involved in cell wall biosynthesis
MRILHIVPGSGGGFYCQNCLRDLALARALRRQGHDAIIVPLYLPMLDAETAAAPAGPVFFGAVNLYLRERLPWLRRAPAWIGRALNAAPVLRYAARKAGSTRARGLEELTLSMLRGEDGRQAAELQQLVDWLAREGRPDVVHLSNALLLGLARRVRREVGAPVVCSLQDEDQWIDPMQETYRERVWDAMREQAVHVARFLPVSHWYGERMRARLGIEAARLSVVYLGLDWDGYADSSAAPDAPVLGYLSRLCESLGFGLLAEAFIRLHREPRFRHLRLCATGGQTGDDRAFLARVWRDLDRHGLRDHVDIWPAFDLPRRQAFLRSLSLLSVPAPRGEAFGLFQLEALACGVPLVLPAAGAFPELLAATGGGITCAPDDVGSLATALARLLDDPEHARALGRAGQAAVRRRFTAERMAADLAAACAGLGPA